VLVPGPVAQDLHDLVDVDPAPRHGVGELVEDEEAVGLRGEVALDLLPALAGVGGVVVVGALLAGPGPALAHLVPGDRAALAARAERAQGVLLADLPLRALDELEDPDRPALVPRAQRQAEGSRRLALHLAGVHDEQRPVATLARGQAVVRHGAGLALGH
jgi:hypothetical protein